MKKIHKLYDRVEDLTVGDILEISDNVFLKITKLKRDFRESLGGKILDQKNFDGVIVNLNGKR